MIVNASYGAAGLESCAAATTLPLLQDSQEGALWAVLGQSGDLVVVDSYGVLAARYSPGLFPEVAEHVVPVVDHLLGL